MKSSYSVSTNADIVSVTCDTLGSFVYAGSSDKEQIDQSSDYAATFYSNFYIVPTPIASVATASDVSVIYASSATSSEIYQATVIVSGSVSVLTIPVPSRLRAITIR